MAVPSIGRVKEKIATLVKSGGKIYLALGTVHSLLQISTYEWIDKIKNERFSWMGKRR